MTVCGDVLDVDAIMVMYSIFVDPLAQHGRVQWGVYRRTSASRAPDRAYTQWVRTVSTPFLHCFANQRDDDRDAVKANVNIITQRC